MKPVPDFVPSVAAKTLLRESRSGALATLMLGSGDPYCSLANVATAPDGAPLLLISTLAVHTKNILGDPRVSLMIDERREGDPLEGGRLMLMGTSAATQDPAARRRYLARQPEAEMFAGFADFAFYRIAIKAAHLVAGFGRIVDLGPQRCCGTHCGRARDRVAGERQLRRCGPALGVQASRRPCWVLALRGLRSRGTGAAAGPHWPAAPVPRARALSCRAEPHPQTAHDISDRQQPVAGTSSSDY